MTFTFSDSKIFIVKEHQLLNNVMLIYGVLCLGIRGIKTNAGKKILNGVCFK